MSNTDDTVWWKVIVREKTSRKYAIHFFHMMFPFREN